MQQIGKIISQLKSNKYGIFDSKAGILAKVNCILVSHRYLADFAAITLFLFCSPVYFCLYFFWSVGPTL